ncbi:MAG: BatA and WFA domain-containing protein [Bacteroidales bacterium]|nr:BatA and WFA domain-containing protein [Bacteroidales bacterium]
MSFLYPSMFWALTALAIPIAVHLFHFRRHRQVWFSNTALLKTIRQENVRTRRLKHLVALLLRCLFIVALVLAFAFPYAPDAAAEIDTEEGVVGVYIDNSMSMKAQSQKTTLLEDARVAARNLVSKLPPATRYLLLTNSFEIPNEYPMNQEEMLRQLDRMDLEGRPVQLNEVIDRLEMLKKRHGFGKATLFAFSDFQQNMMDLDGVPRDTSLQLVAVPLRAEVDANLAVDTVWLDSPVIQAGLANELHVRMTNHGGKDVKGQPVNLTMNGKVCASATVDLDAGASAELSMQFLLEEPVSTRCAVSLVDYPITFDNDFRFVVEPRASIQVVEVCRQQDRTPLSMVFDEDPQYRYLRMDPSRIDLSALSKAQLIVVDAASDLNATLREALLENASEGASVAFFHDDGRVVDTNTVSVDQLAVRHAFFSDLILDLPQHADLPKVKRHVRLTPGANASVLARLENGDPFLTEQAMGRGRVYEVATLLDPAWSTLSDNALFVPMMLKMALLGGGVGKLSYTLGEDQTLLFNDLEVTGNLTVKVINEDGSFETMPAHEVRNNRLCVFFQDALPEAGYYALSVNDSLCHLLAWNDSRKESELRFMDGDALEKAFEAAGVEVKAVLEPEAFSQHDLVEAMARKSSQWRWFALLALLALAGEVAVLRFWK